jgi:hypothetical protein
MIGNQTNRDVAMRKTLVAAVITLFGVLNAHGGEPPVRFDQAKIAIYPPQQYDHTYSGKLEIIYTKTAEEMARHCPPNSHGQRLGCARRNYPSEGHCFIVIAPAAELEAIGYSEPTIVRHENAHCNGWPADHPGLRSLKGAETADEYYARQYRWKTFTLQATKRDG